MSGLHSAPRVLLADDHGEMLKMASSVLDETCDIVESVTDGAQAVESAVRLNPDVVVLDITMPGLDGFQAARELRRRGSHAKVVFLSLHEGDEFVATGFRAGGQAFVSKQRMPTDLPSAVKHVLAGRVFLPSLSSLSAVAPRGGHGVMFYSSHDAWCDQAARLVRSALTRGDGVVFYGPSVSRIGVANRLTGYGFDTTEAMATGRYTVADAAETLYQILTNGRPDPRRIAEIIDNLEEARRALPGPDSRMTVVGEIAACLSAEQRDVILGIERLWSDLARDRPLLTVCGYSTDLFLDDGPTAGADTRPWPAMCDEHWAVTQALDD